MSIKHKSFRKVLLVEKFESTTTVHWCIVEKETSKSIYTKHIGVIVYKNSVKHSGCDAKFYTKPIKLNKNEYISVFSKRELNYAYTTAYWSFMGGHSYVGNVVWFDQKDGVGYVKAHNINLPFYVVNAKEKEYASGDMIRFRIHQDPNVTKTCGAIDIEKVA